MIGAPVLVRREVYIMQQTKIKTIVLITLLGLILGVIVISFHHHDDMFLLPACSLCKVKTSVSWSVNKIKIDTAPVISNEYLWLTVIILCLSGIAPKGENIFFHSRIVDTYPNKAPPFSF